MILTQSRGKNNAHFPFTEWLDNAIIVAVDSNGKQLRQKPPPGRLNAMYHALRTRTANQVGGAVAWFSHLAVRLRLQRAITCPRCERDVTWSPLYRRLRLCPSCNYHFAISARQRLHTLVDPNSFSPFGRTREAVIAGKAKIADMPAVLIMFDFHYHGGTMSIRAGQLIVQAFGQATELQLPVVALVASGGVRIQQGLPALLRMASTTQAVLDFQQARRPFIAVLTHPTTGGVYASFASLADVLMAEPGALIGFAGPRVAEAATGEELPLDSHRAEFALENGMIDAIIPRHELRDTIGRLLSLTSFPAKIPSASGESKVVDADSMACGGRATALEILALARHRERPTAAGYVARLFTDFVELHGDRMERDDRKILGGLARLEGQPVVVVAQMRDRDEEHERGASGAGYRKAERLVHLAARFGLPVITLIDTPGADPGYESEKHGIAGAIAHSLAAILSAPVPTISVVIGEGTSGGALALAATDRVLMQENAIYSVISPEGASAILYGNGSRKAEAAKQLRMTARDLLPLGIVDQIVEEPEGGAHTNVDAAAAAVSAALCAGLAELQAQSDAERLAARRARYRQRSR
jgi:acetyl-CoA carboxylase carboxyl transferase subunit beta